jgi:hypothetical protein
VLNLFRPIIYYFPLGKKKVTQKITNVRKLFSDARSAKVANFVLCSLFERAHVASGDLRIKCLKGSSRALCLPFFNSSTD